MGRFRRVLAAAVLAADPELAQERERRAREAQDVFAFDSEDGLKPSSRERPRGMRCGSWRR